MDLTSITEYGGLGLAALLIYLSYSKDKDIIKMVTNHINHNTIALERLCGLIDRISRSESNANSRENDANIRANDANTRANDVNKRINPKRKGR